MILMVEKPRVHVLHEHRRGAEPRLCDCAPQKTSVPAVSSGLKSPLPVVRLPCSVPRDSPIIPGCFRAECLLPGPTLWLFWGHTECPGLPKHWEQGPLVLSVRALEPQRGPCLEPGAPSTSWSSCFSIPLFNSLSAAVGVMMKVHCLLGTRSGLGPVLGGGDPGSLVTVG